MAKIAVFLLICLAAGVMSKKKVNRMIPPSGVRELSEEERKNLPGFKETHHHRGVTMIPEQFDAREKWPACDSIKTIRDQGQCGTCWAVAAASILSDRICVATGKNIFISSIQAASCSQPGKTPAQNCNDGGDAQNAYKHAALYGIETGGEFNSNKGCVPYSVPPTQNPPPGVSCQTSCTNKAYTTPFASDKNIVDGYWADYKPADKQMTQAEIDSTVQRMQLDLMVSGPLSASMTVFSDFQEWEGTDAPYCQPAAGAKNFGGHAIRVIGWGKTAAGVKYWKIANSWSDQVGEKGVFYIQMGKNCVGIERTISAPIVKAASSCSTASFCEKPIDQAVQVHPTDAKSPSFLFQGNCTQQVTVAADGKLTPVGPARPINSQFLGGPDGPIVNFIIQNNEIWLLNDKGKAGAACKIPSGASKATCGGGSGSTNPGATAVIPGASPARWSYYGTQHKDFLFNTQGQGTHIAQTIAGKFTKVNAMLNVDGKKALVFGAGTAGATAGVLTYPGTNNAVNTGGQLWVVAPQAQKALFTKCA